MEIVLQYIIIFGFGVLMGNFATTIFYRLPRGLVISGFDKKNTKPPCCSTCHHDLKAYEYLPVISIFTTWFKCNYCGSAIPYSYVMIEQAGAFWALVCFWLFGSNPDLFLLAFCFGISSLLSGAIFARHQKVYPILSASLLIEGVLYHALADQTLIYLGARLGVGAIICLWLIRGEEFFNEERYWLINIIIPGFVWLDLNYLIYFLPLIAAIHSAGQRFGLNIKSFTLNTIVLFVLVIFNLISAFDYSNL